MIAARPVVVAEQCRRTIAFSREDIAEFARLTGDTNPLHLDVDAAAQAHHGRIIASGQQTTSQMIGPIASHFSRQCERFAREVLCLNFNFAFKAPVFADAPVDLLWTVSAVDWHARLGGWVVLVDGSATSLDRQCVVGRGTLLVKCQEAPA